MSALTTWLKTLFSILWSLLLGKDSKKVPNNSQQRQDDRQHAQHSLLQPNIQNNSHQVQDDGQKSHGPPDQLDVLCRTMDPLVAAEFYNIHFSPFGRLPDELMLLVLEHIGDDVVTLYCLRRVSRRFRYLIYDEKFRQYTHLPPLSGRKDSYQEDFFLLSQESRKRFIQLLRRDGMCADCKILYPHRLQAEDRPCCQFGVGLFSRRYCHGCKRLHPAGFFNSSGQNLNIVDRECLGRQGAVQLCEHVKISWASIEKHIISWRQNCQIKLEDFKIECRHPSHDMRCSREEMPTWPRAWLMHSYLGSDQVFLNMVWEPHSSLTAPRLTSDARAKAADLRAIFRKFRQGPASIILPRDNPDSLPEMACFDPNDCNCLSYQRDDKESSIKTVPRNCHTFFDRYTPLWKPKADNHYHYYAEPYGSVLMSIHRPYRYGGRVCLIARYRRYLQVYDSKDLKSCISPTHSWLHAMDPDTYIRPQSDLPSCKDPTCTFYYRKVRKCPKEFLRYPRVN